MANQFLNAQEYSNVMLLLLKNQLVMGKLVDGQYKDQVSDENGLTVSVKRPPRFIDKKDGTANLATQDIVTGSAPVSVDQYSKVHIEIGDIEYVESYNALMQNSSMKSAASTLAHSLDGFLIGLTKKFHSWVGGANPTQTVVAGNATDPTLGIQSPAQAQAAFTRLMSQGVPDDGMLSGLMTFEDAQRITGSLSSSYEAVGNQMTALQRSRVPMLGNVDWYGTQAIPVLTGGTRTQGNGSSTGGQINGANQNVNYRDVKGSGSSTTAPTMTQDLILDGVGASATIEAGAVFTIEGVYAYDWRSHQALDYLQQFTVIDAETADGSGNVTVTISPAIIVPGTSDGVSTDANTAFGTVDSIPADDAYVQFAGAAAARMPIRSAFHKRAISLVSARLQMPFTGVASYAVDPDTGISIRYWRGSDISTGKHIHRWDCLYGGAVLDPFLGTRIAGVADA